MRLDSSVWWLSAALLSLLLHALLFISFAQQRIPAAEQQQNPFELTSVRLSFLQPLPKPQPEPEPEIEPEPEPEPEQTAEPEPIPEPEQTVEPKPTPEPKLEPVPVSKPKPKPEPAPKTKPKPKPKKEPKTEPKQQANPLASQPPPQRSEPKARPISAAELKQRYLAALLARIEARKSYPNAARRRAIEGEIRVSFNLACDGSVNNVEIPDGHKLLRVSAADALRLAQPFPQPPDDVDCPFSVSYAMAFELR